MGVTLTVLKESGNISSKIHLLKILDIKGLIILTTSFKNLLLAKSDLDDL